MEAPQGLFVVCYASLCATYLAKTLLWTKPVRRWTACHRGAIDSALHVSTLLIYAALTAVAAFGSHH